MAKIINGSTIHIALADYLATNAYLNDTAQDVLCMVAKWIDEAPGINVPKWIPVTERLPEHDGRYICNIKSFAFPGTFYQSELRYEHGGWSGGNDVTHWMPLPEPPKEADNA